MHLASVRVEYAHPSSDWIPNCTVAGWLLQSHMTGSPPNGRRVKGTELKERWDVFRTKRILLFVLLASAVGIPLTVSGGPPRLITVIADKDNLFKIPGQKIPVVTMKANEVVHLRITANKSTEWDKDGTVHSFTVNALKDQGWDLRLKEGTQDFTLVAPAQPGNYVVECTVKCGQGHDDMKMKLVVTP